MGSAIFRRISAQNLFQHLIISCCNAPTQRTKIPMLPGKYTEQYYSNAPPMDSTIFRRISTWNLFQHIIISCYEARTEGTKKTDTGRKMYRTIFFVCAYNGKCHFLEDFRSKPFPTYHNFLSQGWCGNTENSDTSRKMYRKIFLVNSSNGKCHFSKDINVEPLPTYHNFLLWGPYRRDEKKPIQCGKCTEQYFSYSPPMGSTIFR